jgi:hypothetical protein
VFPAQCLNNVQLLAIAEKNTAAALPFPGPSSMIKAIIEDLWSHTCNRTQTQKESPHETERLGKPALRKTIGRERAARSEGLRQSGIDDRYRPPGFRDKIFTETKEVRKEGRDDELIVRSGRKKPSAEQRAFFMDSLHCQRS